MFRKCKLHRRRRQSNRSTRPWRRALFFEGLEDRRLLATVPGDFATIQAALDAAADGTIVDVAEGTYTENITIGSAVTLRALGDVTLQGAAGTKLPVVLVPAGVDAVIEGFEITGGENGGIAVVDASPVIRGNTIRDNIRESVGAGIDVFGNAANPIIVDNIIENNRHYQGPGHQSGIGGGIAYRGGPDGLIRGNVVRGNNAWNSGGGIYTTSDVMIVENIVDGNSADYGGGIWVAAGSPLIKRNLVTDNFADYQGTAAAGIVVRGGSPRIENNTITANRAFGIHVAGATGSVAITNNLIVANGGGGMVCNGTETLTYNDVWQPDDTPLYDNNCSVGVGSFSADPLLDELFMLPPNSPAIDAGHPDVLDSDGTRSDVGWTGGTFQEPDDQPPTVSVTLDATTAEPTPVVNVSVTDNAPLDDGLSVLADVDLNGNGSFHDPGETAYASASLVGGTAMLTLTPRLPDGEFTLRVRVEDSAGNEGSSELLQFVVDTTLPQVTIEPVDPTQRFDPVEQIRIEFSEPVTGFGVSNLRLTRDGGDNLLSDQQSLAMIDERTYELRGLTPLTQQTGHYDLTLAAAPPIEDVAGNRLAGDSHMQWEKQTRPLVKIRSEVVGYNGDRIANLHVGDEFLLRIFVDDLRAVPHGVFASYVDVTFDEDIVSPIGVPLFGDAYRNAQSFSLQPGLLDNVGATDGIQAGAGGERLLFTMPFSVDQAGDFSMTVELADDVPARYTLLLGDPDERPVTGDEVVFEPAVRQLRANPLTWHNAAMPFDVNDNGLVSPLDALLVINWLNTVASGDIPETAEPGPPYVDVDNDGAVIPLDALMVINRMNESIIYETTQLTVGDDVETRLYHQGFHFGSFIEQANGAVIFRPHPGLDPNGWGSSYFIAPYFAGPSSDSSLGRLETIAATPDGIWIQAAGAVSAAGAAAFGTWAWEATLTYDPLRQAVMTEGGQYQIELPASMANTSGDLNLYRINSNFLAGVPLQDPPGEIGNTGDLRWVDVGYAAAGDPRDFRWLPAESPAHFPAEASSFLRVAVEGDRNVVSTLDQGHNFQIAVAEKPTLALQLEALNPLLEITWGGIYDVNYATDFAADNVGVAAILRQGATEETELEFAFEFLATPPIV